MRLLQPFSPSSTETHSWVYRLGRRTSPWIRTHLRQRNEHDGSRGSCLLLRHVICYRSQGYPCTQHPRLHTLRQEFEDCRLDEHIFPFYPRHPLRNSRRRCYVCRRSHLWSQHLVAASSQCPFRKQGRTVLQCLLLGLERHRDQYLRQLHRSRE